MTEFKVLEERKYLNDDIKKINIRPEDKGRGLEGNLENMIAVSFYDGDQIVGIVGASKINDNTCELWIMLDECSKKYIKEIYHYAFRYLDDVQRYFERIQAITATGWSAAVHFLERLGFEKEGLMKKFGPDGDDYFLYGRIRQCRY